MINQNPVVFPCFSPSPPPVEVRFILQFIYTYIVSMHKGIAHPNLNDRGALVGSFFFFNVGITLIHIGDNLQTQNKPKGDAKTEITVLDVSCFTLIFNDSLNYYVFLCIHKLLSRFHLLLLLYHIL